MKEIHLIEKLFVISLAFSWSQTDRHLGAMPGKCTAHLNAMNERREYVCDTMMVVAMKQHNPRLRTQ